LRVSNCRVCSIFAQTLHRHVAILVGELANVGSKRFFDQTLHFDRGGRRGAGGGGDQSTRFVVMRTRTIGVLFSTLVLAAAGCNDDADDEPAKAATARPVIQQVPPPLDLKEPPKDAMKTASGLIYKKLTVRDDGEMAKRSDTVMVRYTGWRQSTGETFFTTNGGGEALGIDVAYAAPSFGEALQELRKGEKAVLWVPPGQGTPETLVYEVEVVDIKSPAARTPG
jgi:hypothetical protein